MNTIAIRKATASDLSQLQTVSRDTFLETYTATNTAENMQQYVAEKLSTAQLSSELQNPNCEFYFAADHDDIIGYLKLNAGKAQKNLQDDSAIEIERIYVLKAYQGKNIGQLLYQKAIAVAADKGVKYIWLGVWEENHKAIAFYQKNGFVEFDKCTFKLGQEVQTDLMMKKEISFSPLT